MTIALMLLVAVAIIIVMTLIASFFLYSASHRARRILSVMGIPADFLRCPYCGTENCSVFIDAREEDYVTCECPKCGEMFTKSYQGIA